MCSKTNEISGLAKIEDSGFDHPVDLFRNWHDDARIYNHRLPDACCLATISKDNRISARNVVLREFDNDGFVIVTDKRSRKASDIESNPNVAMTFLWLYLNKKDQEIARQVRVEGAMRRMEREEFIPVYEREPIFCKIRSHLCHQGKPADWNDLKRQHDQLLDDVCKEGDLPMPDHFIGYKLEPTVIEFYFARDNLIGDRLLYRKEKSGWSHIRIQA